MRNKSMFSATGWGWLAAILVAVASPANGQTHFDKNVPSGAATTFEELTTFSTPTGIGPNRKSMARVITTAPVTDVIFKIVTPAGKTDPEIPVPGAGAVEVEITLAPVTTNFNTTLPAVTVAAGFAMILVTIDFDGTFDFGLAAETWSLQVGRGGAARRFVGVVATGTDPPGAPNEVEVLATRPKLAPIPTLNFGDVQTNLPDALFPVRNYQLQNIGTGTLTISGSINPPASAFAVFGGFGVPPIDPMATVSVPIRFRPITQGTGGANSAMTIINVVQPAPPAPPIPPEPVSFTGRGVSIDGIMLMDLSGSMAFSLDGLTESPPELESRLWQAKLAGLQLYQAYNELTGGQARFGIYGFFGSGVFGDVPDSVRPVPLNTSALVLGPVTTALGRIQTGGVRGNGGTPMAEGIKIAHSDLPSSSDTLRPTIMLLSDGAQNVPSTNGPATPDDWIPSLSTKGIRVFPVAYGVPGAPEVDHAQLQRLATGTQGVMLPANPTDFIALKKAFYVGLREWLGLRDVIDPKSTITASQSKSHDVCIDDQARAVVFTVNWGTNQTNAVQFDLETPTGVNVTAGPNASVFRSPAGTMWIAKGDLVRQGAGAGLWRLNLRGAQNLQGGLTYGYTAQVQSYVATPSNFTLGTTFVNWLVTANLATVQPQLREKAKVTVRYDRPEESYGTYLATEKIDPSWLVAQVGSVARPGVALESLTQPTQGATRVPTKIMGEVASLAQRKAWGLANIAKRPFGNRRSTGTLELFDNGTNGDSKAGDGIYTATGFTAKVDGIYEMVLEIAGQSAPRQCLQLMSPFSKYVAVGLNAVRLAESLTWAEVDKSPFFDDEVTKLLQREPERGTVRRMVVVTPRDQGGNYYGPGHANDVRFTLTDARPVGVTQDRLDGSYAQVVEYASTATPVATVSAAGVTSNTVPAPRTVLPWWFWILLLLLVVLAIVILRKRRAGAGA